jgi:hypothetical protein
MMGPLCRTVTALVAARGNLPCELKMKMPPGARFHMRPMYLLSGVVGHASRLKAFLGGESETICVWEA